MTRSLCLKGRASPVLIVWMTIEEQPRSIRDAEGVEVLLDDLDQALAEVFGNGKSGNLEVCQHALKLSGLI